MNYTQIVEESKKLSLLEQLNLTSVLIQLITRAIENQKPVTVTKKFVTPQDTKTILSKLPDARPKTTKALVNSIKTLYNFKGGISNEAIQELISALIQKGVLTLSGDKVLWKK